MITPQIIFSDPNFLIVNKPAGMIVNNADSSKELYTIQDFISENYNLPPTTHNLSNSEFFVRGGIVHRLDKETSGALIIALNEDSFSTLQRQFKEKTIKKVYLSLVHGKLVEMGEINVPIGRLPWNRMRFGVIPQGREAFTKFKVIKHLKLQDEKNFQELSLVEVYPQTGRTHQIRVHMQYAGHPVFGDSLYAGRKTYANDKRYLGRHFLHASKISFISPTTGTEVTFEVPLSPELTNLLAILKPLKA